MPITRYFKCNIYIAILLLMFILADISQPRLRRCLSTRKFRLDSRNDKRTSTTRKRGMSSVPIAAHLFSRRGKFTRLSAPWRMRFGARGSCSASATSPKRRNPKIVYPLPTIFLYRQWATRNPANVDVLSVSRAFLPVLEADRTHRRRHTCCRVPSTSFVPSYAPFRVPLPSLSFFYQ